MVIRAGYESYLRIDHRESPGISEEEAARVGSNLPVGKGMLFESGTVRCAHCPRQVILNPLRARARGYAPCCDRYLCDECTVKWAVDHTCRPWQRVIDDFVSDAKKKQSLVLP